jgi:hypothetical protein
LVNAVSTIGEIAEGQEVTPPTRAAAPPHTVVVLQTHYMNKSLARFFARLTRGLPAGYEARVLMHVPPGTPKPPLLSGIPHHFVTTPEIRDPAYINKASGGPDWGIWRGGHTDLIALHFFKANRQYERYWFVEYDVRFSGDWSDFFGYFDRDEAAFLSTSMRRAPVDPNWMHWPTLHIPDAVGPVPDAERITAFMPVYRISRQGLEAIDRAYRQGWSGHCEATWPTILHHCGLSIADFGGNGEFVAAGNRNRFYTNTPQDKDLAPGSLVFRPARAAPGSHRNWLWHPVKPLRYRLREDARHIWVMLKPYLQRLRGSTSLLHVSLRSTGRSTAARRDLFRRSP